MYNLFNTPVTQKGGGLALPAFRRVRDGLLLSIQTIQTYQRNNPRTLPASHFLIKVLNGLNISMALEPQIYSDKVSDWALNQSMILKMTSSIFRGRLFEPGVFFGPQVSEILIAHTDAYDVEDAVANWHDLQPIRVISHPFCDLDLRLSLGKAQYHGSGFAVIAINIPMLALQYKMWRQWERIVNDDSPQTVMQFLQAFPIPNMLISQVDVALLNRMINMYFEGQMPKPTNPYPFYLIDWTREVDEVLKDYLQKIDGRQYTFNLILDLLPTVNPAGILATLQLPEESYTYQMQWAVVISRLVVILFLVQYNARQDNQNNRLALNLLKRYFKMVEVNRGLQQALPADKYQDVMQVINEGIKPYL